MTAPVHFIELYADRGEIAPRLVCTATPDAYCRRRPVDRDIETWDDDTETTPGHECWATEWIDAGGWDSLTWAPESGVLASVPVHVSYDHRGVLVEPVVLPNLADLLPVTADGTHRSARAGVVVSIAAELDALPVGTPLWCSDDRIREVMLSNGRVALRGFDGGHEVMTSRIASLLPATLLFRPDAPQPATTDDAVERAARAWHQEAERQSECLMGEWDALYPDDRARALQRMRAALAAAGAGDEVDREALRSAIAPAIHRTEAASIEKFGVSAGLGSLSDSAADAVLALLAARGDATTPTVTAEQVAERLRGFEPSEYEGMEPLMSGDPVTAPTVEQIAEVLADLTHDILDALHFVPGSRDAETDAVLAVLSGHPALAALGVGDGEVTDEGGEGA